MQLTIKYDLGQRVVAIHRTSVERPPVKCHACDDGTVLLRGEIFECPACKGRKQLQARDHGWVIHASGNVGAIRIEHGIAVYDKEVNGEFIDRGEICTEIKYMLDTTGVGSGTLHDESSLYPSREEAQAVCDARNHWKTT